jgi:putative transposase
MIPLAEKRSLVEADNDRVSVVAQCDLLGLHRSGVYYEPVPEKQENLDIMLILDKQYFETPFYGVERLLAMLIGMGYLINRKRLRRLLKVVGWQTLYPKKRTTVSDPDQYKFPYRLKGLTIDRKNQVWEIDITYVPMQKGHLYLFAIIDVYTRYIVGWSLSNTMTATWCVETIREAIDTHGKPEIINSDQGSQFTGNEYVDFMQEKGVVISMDSKGRAIDNIYIERFWRSIKYEHIYLFSYETGKELMKGLNWYFDFYNGKRIHESLCYKTPKSLYSMASV